MKRQHLDAANSSFNDSGLVQRLQDAVQVCRHALWT